MPLFTDARENAALDTLIGTADFASLHSAYSASGANELTGGSPAYARQGIAWDSAASGQKLLTGTETFDVPAAGTVAWIGLWDEVTAGNFYGMVPNVGNTGAVAHPFTATTGDTVTSPGHALSNDQRVVFIASAGTLPTGVTEGTMYWVIGVSGDTFQVSTTQGGAAVDLTAAGSGHVSRIIPEGPYGSQGTFNLTEITVALPS